MSRTRQDFNPTTDINDENFNADYRRKRALELERLANEMYAEGVGVEAVRPIVPQGLTEAEQESVLDRMTELASCGAIPLLSGPYRFPGNVVIVMDDEIVAPNAAVIS